MADDVSILRAILQRELETINAYEEMQAAIKDPALRQIVEHITDEEREHVVEMYELILQRDARQQTTAQKGRQHLAGAIAAPAITVPAPPAAPAAPPDDDVPVLLPGGAVDLIPPPAPVFEAAAWSVGSLKRSS